jgi:hypothetical protein
MALLTPKTPPLPRTVDIRFEFWTPSADVFVGATLNDPRAKQSLTPFVTGTDRAFGYTGAHVVHGHETAAGLRFAGLSVPKKFTLEADRHYRVRMVREAKHLSFFVDDVELISEPITDLDTRQLLLQSSWGKPGDIVHFANLEIRVPKTSSPPGMGESEKRKQAP